MRRNFITLLLLSFFVSSLFLSGCKKEDDDAKDDDIILPTISMTTKLDGTAWTASTVNATYNGYLGIAGANSTGGTIMFTLNELREGTFEFGEKITVFATYSSSEQVTYTTVPHGSGELIITSLDTENKIITGTFHFSAKNMTGQVINSTDGQFTTDYN